MIGKTAVLLLALAFLVAFLYVEAKPAIAEYNGEITIDAYGNVNPSTAPLKQTGNVYSLTSDSNGSITVNKDSIVLNGGNHKLTAPSIFSSGITLNGVSHVTVTNFLITGGAIGIHIIGASNTISNNTISGTDNGIYALSQPTAAIALHDASSNSIEGNNIDGNRVGIVLASMNPKKCSNNQIVENNFIESSIALIIYDSSNNRIYHNNFFNNEILIQDQGYHGQSLPSFNIWDDGQHFGNYWSDYQTRYPNAAEKNSSGVGDTPYLVRPDNYVDPATLTRQEAKDHWTKINAQYAENTDHYPLLQPLNLGNYLLRTTPPKISVLSPLSQSYNESSIVFVFTVDKPFNQTEYSLDGEENVTVAGNFTLTDLSNGLHNITVRAIDTYGNTGASETIQFTVKVPDPFPTVPVASAFLIAIVAVGAGLLVYFKKHRAKLEDKT